jgi:electron transport complex protein RnfG
MYRALVGLGLLCGLLIVSVFAGTLPVIERNRAEQLEQAVFEVLPGAVTKRSFFLPDTGAPRPAKPEDPGSALVHAGYTEDGGLVGIAVPGRAMGYADVIDILYGYSPDREAVIGMRVLASKETPGLGDKIGKDPAFLANFTDLDMRLDATGTAPLNPVHAVKQGEKTEPWQIDGITGATISSKAIAAIMRQGGEQVVPRLQAGSRILARREVDDGGA